MTEIANLTVSAYERLRADLLACRLRPGERLRIADLCQHLGVSLPAVREALSRLMAEGLVVGEPRRAIRVAPISAAELKDITDVRLHVEGLCLRRSIETGDLAWEAGMVSAYHHLSRTPEREAEDANRLNDAWSLAHGRFHEALVAACDSPWLLRLRGSLHAQSERYRRLSIPLARANRDLGQEHRAIMEACLARDADAALAALRAHLALTTTILLDADIGGDARTI